MSTSPNSPKLFKGGIDVIDPDRLLWVASLPYNADSLARKVPAQESRSEGRNRVEPSGCRAMETTSFAVGIQP